jgi:hypothetical protein
MKELEGFIESQRATINKIAKRCFRNRSDAFTIAAMRSYKDYYE